MNANQFSTVISILYGPFILRKINKSLSTESWLAVRYIPFRIPSNMIIKKDLDRASVSEGFIPKDIDENVGSDRFDLHALMLDAGSCDETDVWMKMTASVKHSTHYTFTSTMQRTMAK